MVRARFWLGIALVVVAVGLSWLLINPPWEPSLPATTVPSPASPTPPPLASEPAGDAYTAQRRRMVVTQIQGRGVSDAQVLAAMVTVPRHLFVPADVLSAAYGDHPLPIGYGQTISQPYIVAWMTELLALEPGAQVLEIGTGSGYQAAVLGEMGMEVYTVEIVEELAAQATERLADMGYERLTVRHGDGYYGWEDHAPYDAIIVTCAPDHIPPALVQQLADGGRMVLPVGPPGGYQSLWLVEKQGAEVKTTEMGGVMFVPLTGEH